MKVSNYPYIIAEIGCNHNGDLDLAKKMIRVAKEKGADAVKFQLWLPEELQTKTYSEDLNNGKVKIENVSEWKTSELGLNNIFEQIKKYSIGYKEHEELFKYARQCKIDYLSTAITNSGIDFLIEQNVRFIKIASCDVDNTPLLEYLFTKDYPAIISIGMASLGEIENLVNMIPEKTRGKITLLHCVSIYPPEDAIINLRFIDTLKNIFGLNVGYSDHSLGTSIPLAAIALGANIIEKHFTLDKNMPGWDHKVSADPNELEALCYGAKKVFNSLGDGRRKLSPIEIDKRQKFRRSLTSARKIKKGEVLKKEDLVTKRPGTGISPSMINYALNRIVKEDIAEDQTIFWSHLV